MAYESKEVFASLIFAVYRQSQQQYPSHGVIVGIGRDAKETLPYLRQQAPLATYVASAPNNVGVTDTSADLVFGINLVKNGEYSADRIGMRKEIRRVLKPDGIVLPLEFGIDDLREIHNLFHDDGYEPEAALWIKAKNRIVPVSDINSLQRNVSSRTM